MANNNKFNKDIAPIAPVSLRNILDELNHIIVFKQMNKELSGIREEYYCSGIDAYDEKTTGKSLGLHIKQGDFSNVYDSTKLAEDEAAANALAKKLSKKDTLIQDLKDMFNKFTGHGTTKD